MEVQCGNFNSPLAAMTTAKVIAMRNELVLTFIAKKMGAAADLRVLRRTCTLWNRMFAPVLHQTGDQEFLELIAATDLTDDTGHRIQNLTYRFEKSMWYWTALMRERNLAPGVGQAPVVTKYRLLNLHAADPIDLGDFFGVCGATITHLDLVFNGLWHKRTGTPNPVNVDWIRGIVLVLTPNLVDLRIRIFRIQTYSSTSQVPLFSHPDLSVSGVSFSYQDRKIPKLRRLEFDVGAGEAYTSLLIYLLQAATGLGSISLDFNGVNGSQASLLYALGGFIPPKPFQPPPLCLATLTTLEIHNLTETELMILRRLATEPDPPQALRLQKLTTSVTEKSHSPVIHVLRRFLETQSATLTQLDLEFTYDNSSDTKLDLPTLSKVRSFRLKCNDLGVEVNGWCTQILTKPLEVVFPSLAKLEYVNRSKPSNVVVQLDIPDPLEGLGHPRVTDLRLNTKYIPQNARNSVGVGEGLRLKFGALTNLQLNLKANRSSDANALLQICASLPSLEILHLVYSDFGVSPNGEKQRAAVETVLELDSLLSGVPKHKLGSLKRFLDFSGPMGRITRDSLQAFVRDHRTEEYGLQDLRVLKKFVIEYHGARFRLTNIGGYFGLALASTTVQHITIETFDLARPEPALGGANGSTLGPRIQKWDTRGHGGEIRITESCERFLHDIFGQSAVIRF